MAEDIDKVDREVFRERVKVEIKNLGVSARAIEEDLGLSKGSLSRIYGGRKNLDPDLLGRLAFRLSVDPLLLVGGTGLAHLVPPIMGDPIAPPNPIGQSEHDPPCFETIATDPGGSQRDEVEISESALVALTMPQFLTAPVAGERKATPAPPAYSDRHPLPMTFSPAEEEPAAEPLPKGAPPVRWVSGRPEPRYGWVLPMSQAILLAFLTGGLVGYATASNPPVLVDDADPLSDVVVESFLHAEDP